MFFIDLQKTSNPNWSVQSFISHFRFVDLSAIAFGRFSEHPYLFFLMVQIKWTRPNEHDLSALIIFRKTKISLTKKKTAFSRKNMAVSLTVAQAHGDKLNKEILFSASIYKALGFFTQNKTRKKTAIRKKKKEHSTKSREKEN